MQISHRQSFWLVLLIGLSVRLFFAFYVPLYPAVKPFPGYNDEPLHLYYVQHIASGNGWPIWEQSTDSLSNLTDSFVQPPLYYSLVTPMFNIGKLFSSKLLFSRLFSVLCGILTALLVYRMALFRSKSESIALASFAVIMLAPNSVIFSSIVTNDALIMLTSALFIYLLIQHGGKPLAVSGIMILGLSLSVAVWSKMSGLTLIPLVWFAVRNEKSKSLQWIKIAATLTVVVICISPLLRWNIANYGEPIPGQTHQLASEYWPPEASGMSGGVVYHPLTGIKHWLRLAVIPFDALWGGWERWFSLLWAVIFSGVFLFGAYQIITDRREGMMYVVGFILVAVGFIWHNIHLFQVEFRLFAPAFPAMAVIAAVGMERLKISIPGQVIIWVTPFVVMVVRA